MKKTYYALIILPTILFIIPIIFYFFADNTARETPQKADVSHGGENIKSEPFIPKIKTTEGETNSGFASVSSIKGYMIRAEKDNVYIYELYNNGFSEKIKTTDINPLFLRKRDKEELEKGIARSSYEEICSLIEDYSS